MLSLKPIFLWRYLGSSVQAQQEDIRSLFYLSYEDALWDLLTNKHIKRGSTILVPDLFCGDVEENIRNHGYVVRHYRVSKLLEPSESDFVDKIKKYNPSVAVIFHTAGITNRMFLSLSWLRHVPSNTILLEDSVHRVVDPSQIKLISRNHVVINSLRKVVPLQGSVIYGDPSFLNYDEPSFIQSTVYRLQVTMLWWIMNVLWAITQLTHGSRLSSYMAFLANKVMIRGYDLIGDSELPSCGSKIMYYLNNHVDITKISRCKTRQVRYYENALRYINTLVFTKVPYSPRDRGLLSAFPLIISVKHSESVIDLFHQAKIRLRLELNDSVWSKRYKMIYLPLGPHLTQDDLFLVTETVKKISELISNTQ